ncbi:unnamed protein product, partial [Larinioides sclopetarius]
MTGDWNWNQALDPILCGYKAEIQTLVRYNLTSTSRAVVRINILK